MGLSQAQCGRLWSFSVCVTPEGRGHVPGRVGDSVCRERSGVGLCRVVRGADTLATTPAPRGGSQQEGHTASVTTPVSLLPSSASVR